MDAPQPGGHDHEAASDGSHRPAVTCYRHPNRETRLACSECGKPICVDCSHDAAVGQRCPECAKPRGRNRIVTVRSMHNVGFTASPVTFTLIAVMVLIHLAGGSGHSARIDWGVLNLGQLQDGTLVGVAAGEWWRVVTGTFLHAPGFTHILFNMYALYVLGPRMEQQVGSPAFAGLYFASAVGGSLTSILLGTMGISVGASGAVFGLFGAWLWAGWRLRHTPGGKALLNRFLLIIGINAALPLLLPQIDWRAHLGGLAIGLGIAAAWGAVAAGKRNARVIRSVIAYGVLVTGLIVAILL